MKSSFTPDPARHGTARHAARAQRRKAVTRGAVPCRIRCERPLSLYDTYSRGTEHSRPRMKNAPTPRDTRRRRIATQRRRPEIASSSNSPRSSATELSFSQLTFCCVLRSLSASGNYVVPSALSQSLAPAEIGFGAGSSSIKLLLAIQPARAQITISVCRWRRV